MTENHVEACKCWDCGGWGRVEYEEPRPDPIVGGELVGKVGHCHTCDGTGNKYRAKITQTTVIRAFLTHAKHALEDIELQGQFELDIARMTKSTTPSVRWKSTKKSRYTRWKLT